MTGVKSHNPHSDAPILMKPPLLDKDPRRIRRMFAGISRSYDLLNHLLSLNVDRSWRRSAARLLDRGAGERVLDLCTGTADLALELGRSAPGSRGGEPPGGGLIVGADFCIEMLRIARRKVRAREAAPGSVPVRLAAADALRLPFAPRSFDAATAAFGMRNLPDLEAGLREVLRVLRPGGRVAILEFTTPPRPWFRALFGLYFHGVLPRIGRLVARSRDPVAGRAYSYLPDSVRRFPDAESLAAAMSRAGFARVQFHRLTLGIACIHRGERPGGPPRGGA